MPNNQFGVFFNVYDSVFSFDETWFSEKQKMAKKLIDEHELLSHAFLRDQGINQFNLKIKNPFFINVNFGDGDLISAFFSALVSFSSMNSSSARDYAEKLSFIIKRHRGIFEEYASLLSQKGPRQDGIQVLENHILTCMEDLVFFLRSFIFSDPQLRSLIENDILGFFPIGDYFAERKGSCCDLVTMAWYKALKYLNIPLQDTQSNHGLVFGDNSDCLVQFQTQSDLLKILTAQSDKKVLKLVDKAQKIRGIGFDRWYRYFKKISKESESDLKFRSFTEGLFNNTTFISGPVSRHVGRDPYGFKRDYYNQHTSAFISMPQKVSKWFMFFRLTKQDSEHPFKTILTPSSMEHWDALCNIFSQFDDEFQKNPFIFSDQKSQCVKVLRAGILRFESSLGMYDLCEIHDIFPDQQAITPETLADIENSLIYMYCWLRGTLDDYDSDLQICFDCAARFFSSQGVQELLQKKNIEFNKLSVKAYLEVEGLGAGVQSSLKTLGDEIKKIQTILIGNKDPVERYILESTKVLLENIGHIIDSKVRNVDSYIESQKRCFSGDPSTTTCGHNYGRNQSRLTISVDKGLGVKVAHKVEEKAPKVKKKAHKVEDGFTVLKCHDIDLGQKRISARVLQRSTQIDLKKEMDQEKMQHQQHVDSNQVYAGDFWEGQSEFNKWIQHLADEKKAIWNDNQMINEKMKDWGVFKKSFLKCMWSCADIIEEDLQGLAVLYDILNEENAEQNIQTLENWIFKSEKHEKKKFKSHAQALKMTCLLLEYGDPNEQKKALFIYNKLLDFYRKNKNNACLYEPNPHHPIHSLEYSKETQEHINLLKQTIQEKHETLFSIQESIEKNLPQSQNIAMNSQFLEFLQDLDRILKTCQSIPWNQKTLSVQSGLLQRHFLKTYVKILNEKISKFPPCSIKCSLTIKKYPGNKGLAIIEINYLKEQTYLHKIELLKQSEDWPSFVQSFRNTFETSTNDLWSPLFDSKIKYQDQFQAVIQKYKLKESIGSSLLALIQARFFYRNPMIKLQQCALWIVYAFSTLSLCAFVGIETQWLEVFYLIKEHLFMQIILTSVLSISGVLAWSGTLYDGFLIHQENQKSSLLQEKNVTQPIFKEMTWALFSILGFIAAVISFLLFQVLWLTWVGILLMNARALFFIFFEEETSMFLVSLYLVSLVFFGCWILGHVWMSDMLAVHIAFLPSLMVSFWARDLLSESLIVKHQRLMKHCHHDHGDYQAALSYGLKKIKGERVYEKSHDKQHDSQLYFQENSDSSSGQSFLIQK